MALNHAKSWQQNYPSQSPQVEKRKVIVRKKGWVTKGEKLLYMIVGLVFIIASYLLISYSSTTDTLNRDLQALEQQVRDQQLKNEGLKFEVQELSRPERIIQKAKENGLRLQDAEVKQANVIQQ